jgi:hypothetical protein
LDSLILTIFSLRIGDQFHTLAEQNLENINPKVKAAAADELTILSYDEIQASSNAYLQSFATVLAGKSNIFKYHIKALEVAALEIQTQQQKWANKSIGYIVINLCKEDESGYLTALFREH